MVVERWCSAKCMVMRYSFPFPLITDATYYFSLFTDIIACFMELFLLLLLIYRHVAVQRAEEAQSVQLHAAHKKHAKAAATRHDIYVPAT